jgi:hypothetical protein
MTNLHPYMWLGQLSRLGLMASDCVDSDFEIEGILGDYVQDHDIMEAAMLDLEIGASYLFKTFGLFYRGRVMKADGRVIMLESTEESPVYLVDEVGETAAVLSGRSPVAYEEPFPPGLVRLNPIHVYAAEDGTHIRHS